MLDQDSPPASKLSVSRQFRRRFLKYILGAGFLGAHTIIGKRSKSISKTVGTNRTANNIIFLVVDGMGRGTLSITNDYSKKLFGKDLNWVKLLKSKDVITSVRILPLLIH